MRLISTLTGSGLTVIVGFTSTDMVLWKAAGAYACATGKFFNLRRFTSSRFEEPAQGGGQLPYWFEESLLAFLRESDVARLQRLGWIDLNNCNNPFSRQILEQMAATPGTAWVRLGWRQFLYGFADLERRISNHDTDVVELLAQAERNWLKLEDAKILTEEPRNNGSWLRSWRRSVLEYS